MRSERVQAIVIGAGGGGGIVAARLAEAGVRTVVLEAGGHHNASEFTRLEARAAQMLWNPPKFADTGGPPIVMVSGKGVGGSTNINTKVGIRAQPQDYQKWSAATGLRNEAGAPFSAADLDTYFERTERRMHVRPRADWTHSVHVVKRGFESLGATLHPVTSYTNYSCESCGSCTAGCPTNAGSTTQNRYLDPALGRTDIDIRAHCRVRRILSEPGTRRSRRVRGVEYVAAGGEHVRLTADTVVVAAGALVTPQLLQLSGLADLPTPAARNVGANLGTHTARMVHGIFDEIMDAHVVYPITAHCKDHALDEDGGFVVEATTLMDPIAVASNLVDEEMRPLWGQPLVDTMAAYRRMAGLFMMTNDSNTGTVGATEDLTGTFRVDIPAVDQARLDEAFAFCTRVLRVSGATGVVATGYLTSHVQGSCRIGGDPERSACDLHHELWDVEGLFVGDASALPRTLTFNPSLTVFALAERLGDHLVARHGKRPRADLPFATPSAAQHMSTPDPHMIGTS